jgi:hypothetical protein
MLLGSGHVCSKHLFDLPLAVFVLQCTEVELLRIRYRTHHEAGVSHEQISTEALNALRERMRINGQADQM